MKTSLLLLTLPLLLMGQETRPDLQWVDNEVAAIKPPRKGIRAGALSGIRDPFYAQLLLNQPPAEEETETGKKPAQKATALAQPEEKHALSLQAVFNRESALIDGKWYKQDDKIYGYVVRKIGYDSVLLQRKTKKLKLSLNTKNDNIKINVK